VAGVLLVAATLLLCTFPLHTHALLLDFPSVSPPPLECELPANPCHYHNLAMAADGQLAWDGQPVTLARTRAMIGEHDSRWLDLNLSFSPAFDASYDATVQMLAVIREDLGPHRAVFICGLDSARRFELAEPDLSVAEYCTGAIFTN